MRLINVRSLKFTEFHDEDKRPKYAIASHRWGADEANFQDVEQGRKKDSLGYKKVEAFAEYVRDRIQNVDWLWIDTCCINKDSAAELSYCINSMFRWYRDADICIAYLPGVAAADLNAFKQDEWFQRGWTLQELLAPRLVLFVTKDWQIIGNKGSSYHEYNKTPTGQDLTSEIAKITNIPESVLRDWGTNTDVRNEDKMKWIENRKTTLKEDKSYALFGIVGITLPVVYGEGEQSARSRVIGALRQRNEVERAEAEVEYRQKDNREEHARMWQAIIEWMSPSDPWTNHESARKLHEQQTGTWLLESSKYKAWKSGQVQCLWLYGKAGCGKTILCSTAIKDMELYCKSSPNYGHAIFYFSFSDARKQKYEDLLTSIIAQLGSNGPGFSMLKRAYEAGASKKPGREDLEEILHASFTSYDLVFFHLDALDECPEEDGTRRVVLQGIEQLFGHAQNLRILVTSRDESDIRRSMELLDLTSISVASELVTPDIQRYIDKQISRVPKLSRLDAATKTLVRETLSKRADGMFRYVFCQLQELTKSKSTRPTTVRNVLLALPATLDGTYERMLSRIDSDDQPYALTLLRWLAFSYEPLTLEQLAEASIIDPTNDPNSDGIVDIDNKGDWADTLEVLAGLVVAITDDKQDYEAPDCEPADEEAQDDDYSVGNDSASSPSSRQIHEGTKVRLAHFSVKEYLQSNRITASKARDYHLDPGREHRFLTHSCLAYLIYYSDSPQKLSSEQDLERFPLLHYAAKRWWNHASEQTYENTIREVRFLTNDTFRHDSLRVSRPDNSWQDPFNQRYTGTSEGPALPFACYSNLYQVVQGLIAAGEDIEAQHDWLGAALHVAAHAGGEAIVRLLVDAGANVNLQGRGFCRTALQAAAINGHEAVVCLLLRAGADVNLQIAGDYNSALQAAAINGHETIIRLLLDAGADVNLPGGQSGSALQAAANRGHKAIVRLLLDAGADVNLQDAEFNRTIVRLFLDAGADVNLQDSESDRTAGRWLLDAGADINLESGAYGGALQAAAVSGHEAIIQLLLDAGADVNLQGGVYGGALQAAALNGHEAIIQLLLDAGADVNLQGGAYGGALQAAARQGHEAAVRLLLDAKVEARMSDHSALHTVSTDGVVMEVEMFSSDTETGADVDAALRVASGYGYERIVYMLLKAGADANAAVRYDKTALQAASSGGYAKIVQMLLDAGADAAQVDEGGRSALMEALGGGHETVVQILGGVPADASGKEQIYGRALIIASGKGRTSVMQSLLEAGADAMFIDGRGSNALVEASDGYGSNEDAVQLLLDATADVRHEEIYGKALVAASSSGHTEVVQMLLNAGADAMFIDEYGSNALVEASGDGYYANVEVVQLLLDATANVPREEICRKALGKASRSRNPEVWRMLLDAIVDAPMSDATYREALIAASKFGYTAIVGRLLEAMPPASLPEEIYQEALLNTARQGHADIMQLPIEASADLSYEGNHHEALIQAVNYGHTSVVRLLLEKSPIVLRQGSCQEALIKAAEHGHLEIVQILLDMTPNVAPEEFCRIASIEALAKGQDKVVQMLSKQFGHAPDQDILCSALIRASEKGRADVVQSLLTATMDAPHEEAYRKVLVNSMLTCDIPFVRLLLDAGADVNDPKTQYHGNWNDELFEPEKDEFSLALHAAACTGVSETVKMLLDAGADVHARDHNGYSALHLASQLRNKLGENGKYEEIVQMLLDAGADFNF